jgi:hypothetical protein
MLSYMRLPEPVTGFLFPARRYMRRRRKEQFQELRRGYFPARPEPLVPGGERQPASDREAIRNGEHPVRSRRLAKIEEVSRDQVELLRRTADELEHTGAAEHITASGQISARITRFRWGDDVIEIIRNHGGGQRGWSLGRLPRSRGPARTAALADHLTRALAALEAGPPPPSSPGGA